MSWLNINGNWIGRHSGKKSSSSYWNNLISVVVTDSTHIELTFSASNSIGSSQLSVWGNTISTASWTGAVLTLIVSRAIAYGEEVVITFVPTGAIEIATNNITAEAEVTSYETRSGITLDEDYKIALNTLVTDLKTGLDSSALSEDFDFIHILGGEGTSDSVLNLVKDAHTATLEGTPTVAHTPLNGTTGDGTGAYINLNYNPKTQGVAYQLNNASILLISRSNAQETAVALGARDAGNTNRTFLTAGAGTNPLTCTGYINTSVTSGGDVAITNTNGIYFLSRTASNLQILYKDGVNIKESAFNSSDLTNQNLTVNALNDAGTPGLFDSRQFMIVAGGRGFSPTEALTVNNAFKKFSETIGSAHCWFSRARAVYNDTAKKSFVGIMMNNSHGHSQYIQNINHLTGAVANTKIGSIYQYEDHNEPSILVRSSDSRLLVAYAEHVTYTTMRFRISTNPLDATAWGAEINYTAGGRVTYVSLFEASDGDIYLIMRVYETGWSYIKSSDGGTTWGGETIISFGIGASGYSGYMIACQSPNDQDIIHFIMSTAHPYYDNDVSVCAFYMDLGDEKFYKLDGTETTANLPFDNINDVTTIMAATRPDEAWIDDIIVDANGNPRYLFTIMTNAKNTNYLPKEQYYAEWTGSALSTPYKLHDAMTTKWVHDSGQPNPNDTYSSLACFNKNNPSEIIASKEVDGICEIYKLTRVSANSFTEVAITSGSKYDNWRPFTINGTYKNVGWLKKIKYGEYVTATGEILKIRTLN